MFWGGFCSRVSISETWRHLAIHGHPFVVRKFWFFSHEVAKVKSQGASAPGRGFNDPNRPRDGLCVPIGAIEDETSAGHLGLGRVPVVHGT